MLAEERQNTIVSIVNENGSVLVKDLSKQFGVTEDSIRKDLTLLQKKGLLKKTYGGAMKVRRNEHEHTVKERIDHHIEDKKEIAQKALDLIADKEVIFLDISTSNVELAKKIAQSGKKVTIVTNAIDVMNALASDSGNVKTIFLGGTFSEGKDGFIGAMTIEEAKRFRFDKAFMGVVGVDLESGNISTYAIDDALTKSQIMNLANKTYMMLESRKFESGGNTVYAQIDDFTGAILDKEVPGNLAKMMKNYPVEWIV